MSLDNHFEMKNTDFCTSCFTSFDFVNLEFPPWYPEKSKSRQCYQLHLHKEMELIYVHQGHLTFLADSKPYELSEGDLLLINPYETHEGLISTECQIASYSYLLFDLNKILQFPCAQLYDKLTPILQGKKHYRNRFDSKLNTALTDIIESVLEHQKSGNNLLVFSDLLRFFDCIGMPDHPLEGKRKSKSNQFTSEVFDFIQHTNPSQITLEDISTHFNYNKNYFSMLFHKNFGISVTNFCLKYKVELAQKLILDGNHNLTEICFRSGFNNYTYFFRQFKKITGFSPSDYLKNCVQEPDYRKNDAQALAEISKKEKSIMIVQSRVLSALVKVFETEDPPSEPESFKLTALKGEHISFQITYLASEKGEAILEVTSELLPYISIRTVEYIPSSFVGYKEHIAIDRNYLKKKPCRFPDCLRDISGRKIQLKKNKYRTIWIEVSVPEHIAPGQYPIRVSLSDSNDNLYCEDTQLLTVYDASLPPQRLIHTEWFHADCIADYYGYEVFSEEHWNAIEAFMKTAVKRGQNMIYTPVFTPPIDTLPGGERTTVQLIDVFCDQGKYTFGFDRFERWVKLALRCGFTYFEISHLATQSGAIAAPKVMATVDGTYKRLFGWDTLLEEPEYPLFLAAFLPELTRKLEQLGISQHSYFHISDEPRLQQMENYLRAKNAIAPYLNGYKIIDANSNVAFFEKGTIEYPIPTTEYIETYIEKGVPQRWVYYCCSHGIRLSNRFFAMKLARTRAFGIQAFKYRLDGFLHWGFNFYNTQNSTKHINPYQISNASDDSESKVTGFPSGDAFVVYPGISGTPEESIRLLAFEAGLNDLRVLQALAEKTSYEHVLSIIEEDLDHPITFTEYPTSDFYYIRLRNHINKELEAVTRA